VALDIDKLEIIEWRNAGRKFTDRFQGTRIKIDEKERVLEEIYQAWSYASIPEDPDSREVVNIGYDELMRRAREYYREHPEEAEREGVKFI